MEVGLDGANSDVSCSDGLQYQHRSGRQRRRSGHCFQRRASLRPRRHSVKRTWRQFTGSLRLMPRKGLVVSPGRAESIDSSPGSASAAEADDNASHSSECFAAASEASHQLRPDPNQGLRPGRQVRQRMTLLPKAGNILGSAHRARSESSQRSRSMSVSPCSPARSRSPAKRHRRKKGGKRRRSRAYAEVKDLQGEAHQTSLALKEKALEPPGREQQLSEAEPEPEMQTSQDEVPTPTSAAAPVVPDAQPTLPNTEAEEPEMQRSQDEVQTSTPAVVPDAQLTLPNTEAEDPEMQTPQDKVQTPTPAAAPMLPDAQLTLFDTEADEEEEESPGGSPGLGWRFDCEGTAQVQSNCADNTLQEEEDEELFLSDLEEQLLEDAPTPEGPRDADADAPMPWPVLQMEGAPSPIWPEPEGEAAELLAELRSQAELLDPGDYWLADDGIWDLEALREDVANQQKALKEQEASAGPQAALQAAAPPEPSPTRRESHAGSTDMLATPTSCYAVRLRQWQARKRARRKRVVKKSARDDVSQGKVRGAGSSRVASAASNGAASNAEDVNQADFAKTSLLGRLDALICQEIFQGCNLQQ